MSGFFFHHAVAESAEEALLKQALEMSMQVGEEETPVTTPVVAPDFSTMTEDEQIAYAMQMSLQPGNAQQDINSLISHLLSAGLFLRFPAQFVAFSLILLITCSAHIRTATVTDKSFPDWS